MCFDSDFVLSKPNRKQARIIADQNGCTVGFMRAVVYFRGARMLCTVDATGGALDAFSP